MIRIEESILIGIEKADVDERRSHKSKPPKGMIKLLYIFSTVFSCQHILQRQSNENRFGAVSCRLLYLYIQTLSIQNNHILLELIQNCQVYAHLDVDGGQQATIL